ncbi:MAG: hypothetical protein LUC83_08725, partial [Clostridiales bacterium]|nr:hypothetical protein [Clostridiales bacterium]
LTDSLYHWQHAHDLAQLLCRESTLPGHKKAIGVACWGMGRTLEDMGGMENQYKALELFQKDLAIMEEVAREEPDWQEVRWDMGIAHSRIAIACQNLGEPGDYEQIFQDPAEVERRRTSGEPGNFRRAIRHYGLWQKIMEKLAEEGRENAEEEVAYSHFLQGQLLLLMALKAEKEWQEAAPGEEGASESSDVQDNETASLMMWTAEIVEDSLKQSREHLEACIDMYRRPDCCTNITEALRQERLSQSYDALEYGLRYLIALLYHDGDAQEDLETEEGYRAALSCYEREAKLEQRLMELHPDLEHRDALAMTYYRLSGVAKAIGGAYLEAALKWNALDLEESLVLYEEEPTAQRARNLATSWLRRARIYGQFHDDGYLPQILECNRKEYEYKNIAWVPSEEEKYTQRLSDAAYRVAKNLRKLGGAERLEEALRYNERDVELAELLLSGVTVAESGEKAMPDGQGDELEKKVLSVAEMEKRRGNLAVSLKLRHQILMDLFAQTGGEEYRVCALAACERALKLRTANAEANPSEKNLEKLETAKKELVEIQLSGV